MTEIATLMSEEEFQEFLKTFKNTLDLESLSYVSRYCSAVEALCRLDKTKVFSVAQIRRICDLAK